MIQIFTDTSANLPASYIQKYALRVIPLTYLIDGVEAHQDPTVDFDGKAYYDAMRSGTTSPVFSNRCVRHLRPETMRSTSVCPAASAVRHTLPPSLWRS